MEVEITLNGANHGLGFVHCFQNRTTAAAPQIVVEGSNKTLEREFGLLEVEMGEFKRKYSLEIPWNP